MFEYVYTLWMNRQEVAKRLVAKAAAVGITEAESQNLQVLLTDIENLEAKLFELADLDC